MPQAATSAGALLSPEMAEMLRAGAAHELGIICRPGQVQKLWPLLREAERLGYLRFLGMERPWITEQGRRAIGAPSQAEADRARLVALCGRRKPLQPRRDEDPRTDFDYRSYRSMDYVCTLVVRQPDGRANPSTVRIGKSLSSDPQFLGPRNAIILPECQGTPFVLALMPKWLLDRALFPTCPFPLDEEDAAWSAEDRAIWDRLRNVCMSVNTRIRRGGNRRPTAKLHYGEYA
ncbi:hypothetical protein IVB12_05345 [Bradyrhizobium sp. 179]|uniref:hypothetical protein n=1 Tax=Bradyrhizobium sp. 179 TaxID=2782648 RepID=UPI001FFAE0D4|nr:hypothetical protein [Bradyrhizobium sp. 179]MCK1541416.1 hypothetical protein [Bradyrhizobium sp. 179]